MSEPPAPAPNPRRLLAAAGLRAKKSWGQNFLCDQDALAQIAATSEAGPQRPVVELGAGLGALTYHLLLRGGHVLAIERDRELVPVLRRALAWAETLEVLEEDAVKLDYAALRARLGGEALTVAGNLPYQLSSRILVGLAEAAPNVERAVLLVQREVAERLVATPGGRDYGLLTVLAGRVFAAEIVRSVSPAAFLPPPKVWSAVVRLVAHGGSRSAAADAHLVRAARAAFSQRRKTLRNAVSGGLGAPKEAVAKAIEAAGIDPGARAETLSIEQFARLGQALQTAGFFAMPAAPQT